MEPRNLMDKSDTKVQESILASVVEIIERSCESEEQALRVQTAHCPDITSFTPYIQIIEHYKQNCFDWTNPKYRTVEEYLHLFVNLCKEGIPPERIKRAIDDVGRNLKKEELLFHPETTVCEESSNHSHCHGDPV